MAGVGLTRWLWPQLEPARSLPLLPPWPWQQPATSKPAAAPLRLLTKGWQARNLGNPAALRYPACWQSLPRTPWDLARFDGRLYVGLGNAANDGPTANAGPVPVLAYALDQGRWLQEATLPDEEISRFVPHGQQLWITGADARGSWRWGNLYRRSIGEGWWWHERRLPRFIHAYDLAWHQGAMVVAGNVPDAVTSGPALERHGSALAVSRDGGRRWSVQRLVGWRATALLPLAGELFAVEALPGPGLKRWLQAGGRRQSFAAVHQLRPDGHWQARPEISAADLLPGLPGAGQRFAWIERTTPAQNQLAWIASVGPWRDDPARRLAFIAKRGESGRFQVQLIPLRSGVQAMDLITNQKGWLLLTSEQRASQRWRSQITAVQASGQRISQTPRLSFEAALPAWSLASDGTTLWVGLGPAPFQPETTPGQCSAADQLSGNVVAISPSSQPAEFE
ncbi:MAG: hypothetical protein ACOYLI_12405 [Synechococcus lacustris]